MQSTDDKQKTDTEVKPITLVPLARPKYVNIVVLRLLNGNFDKKYLVVPFKPNYLKLGRPVVNNNNNKFTRPSTIPISEQIRPDNGNFDSRILSRNHACLSSDPKTGKIYIKDLKSSNGTFVNGIRIFSNEVELEVDNRIDLGTDIDTKYEHRKISAFVENIYVQPLIYPIDLQDGLDKGASFSDTNGIMSTGEVLKVTDDETERAAFMTSIYGDTEKLELEETIMSPEIELLSGIFINNSIGTSSNLSDVIKRLAREISTKKYQFLKTESLEKYLTNFKGVALQFTRDQKVRKEAMLIEYINATDNKLQREHRVLLEVLNEDIRKLIAKISAVNREWPNEESHLSTKVGLLKQNIEDYKTRIEVEKYKKSKLTAVKSRDLISSDSISGKSKATAPKLNSKPHYTLFVAITFGAVAMSLIAASINMVT